MGDLVALHLSSTKARFLDPPGRRACRCGITARGVWSAVLSWLSSRFNTITPSVCVVTSAANVPSRVSIGRGLAALSQAASNDSVDSLRDQGMCCKMNDVQYNLPRGQARFPGKAVEVDTNDLARVVCVVCGVVAQGSPCAAPI